MVRTATDSGCDRPEPTKLRDVPWIELLQAGDTKESHSSFNLVGENLDRPIDTCAMTRTGVDVPGVAIVGYDDIGFAGAAAVPLSSVRQPRELLGRTAAELLLAESEDLDDHAHQQVVFHPELVVRTSSLSRTDQSITSVM